MTLGGKATGNKRHNATHTRVTSRAVTAPGSRLSSTHGGATLGPFRDKSQGAYLPRPIRTRPGVSRGSTPGRRLRHISAATSGRFSGGISGLACRCATTPTRSSASALRFSRLRSMNGRIACARPTPSLRSPSPSTIGEPVERPEQLPAVPPDTARWRRCALHWIALAASILWEPAAPTVPFQQRDWLVVAAFSIGLATRASRTRCATPSSAKSAHRRRQCRARKRVRDDIRLMRRSPEDSRLNGGPGREVSVKRQATSRPW